MKKICLITGCAGFLGSHLTEYLLHRNYKVIGVDNLVSGKTRNIKKFMKQKDFIFYNLDISNIKKIEKKIKKIDYVFHFAGHGELVPSIEKPDEYFKNNAMNTAILINFIRKYKVKKFIYAASSSCYGINNKKINENEKINIEHPYGFSKYIGEQVVFHWGKTYKIPVISIRIFNAYGPRSRTTNVYGAVIGVFIKQKIEGYPLTVVGDGNQKRDFLFVTDLCSAFYKAAKSKYKNEVFNLGSGNPQTINKLSSLISKKKIYIPWRAGEPKITHANISKIKRYLKWKPTINLNDGIKKVLTDIDYWKHAPLWTFNKIKKATKNWNKFLKTN
jgi:UDP-glucose 4-epimerase